MENVPTKFFYTSLEDLFFKINIKYKYSTELCGVNAFK